MRITIKDIARAAGVAHTTVSRALNRDPVISAKTTKRIQALARDMGYVPNVVARNFRSNRTKAIGMVLTTITDPFLSRIVEGVEQAAYDAGYSLFVSTSHEDPKREMAIIRELSQRRVDALIIASMWVSSVYGGELKRIRIPTVLINHAMEAHNIRYVTIDDCKSALEATNYLIELGHTRIGFVKSSDRPSGYIDNRLVGWERALKAAGLPHDDQLVVSPEGHNDFERGRGALQAVMDSKVTAIFCYNDLIALGLLKACHDHGVRVPTDLSVMGFDGLEQAQQIAPTLTTMSQPQAYMGQLATKIALNLVQGREKVESIEIPTQLIARESTRKL